jgi:hypothetical protein
VVVRARPRGRPAAARPGSDSELYAIERVLAEAGLGRQAWEPAARWIERVAASGAPRIASAPLREIVALHCRYRFDPAGISARERAALRARAEAWMAAYRATPSPAIEV